MPVVWAALGIAVALASCGDGSSDPAGARQTAAPRLDTLVIDPPAPWVDSPVRFRAPCAAGGPTTWEWDFGDGTRVSSSQPELAHFYASGATRSVSVRCRDNLGRETALARDVEVYGRNLDSVAGFPCTGNVAGRGWCRQQPWPAGLVLSRLWALDADDLWGIDSSGQVQRSRDGGLTWAAQPLGNGATARALAVVDPLNAWLGDRSGGLWHTADGGRSWQIQREAATRPEGLLLAVDARVAWSLDSGTLLRTVDGGARWEARPPCLCVPTLGFAVDAEEVWLLHTPSNILRTRDAGTTWDELAVTGSGRFAAVAYDAASRKAWAATSGGQIWRIDVTTGRFDLQGNVAVGSAGTITAIAVRGARLWVASLRIDRSGTDPTIDALFHTSPDAGANWQALPTRTGMLPLALAPSSEDSIYLAGSQGLSWWSGSAWRDITQVGATLGRATTVAAPDPQIAWIGGLGGRIQLSTDGGRQWANSVLEGRQEVLDLEAADGRRAWAVTHTTAVHRTADGGRTWNAVATPATGPLFALARAPSGRLWAAGAQGTLLQSGDEGAGWSALAVGSGVHAQRLAAFNDTLAFVVGPESAAPALAGPVRLVAVERSGDTWQAQPVALEPDGVPWDVALSPDGTLWVVGEARDGSGATRVWQRARDERTWRSHAVDGIGRVAALAAVDSRTAWLGGAGVLAMTRDGGATWRFQTEAAPSLVTPDFFLAVQALDAGTALAVSSGGQVWKTLTGGE